MVEYVKIEKGLGPDGRIAVVRFDRGDGINALSPEALRQLTAAARSFEDDFATSVVVLAGSNDAFSAGFDLKDAEGRSRKAMDLGALRRHLKLGPRLTHAWQEMEQITIAAIEGFCIGGGVALAVALDFRVMGSDAHLRVPEIGLGMNMSWQSIPRMLHLIGPARTKQAVILADQRITADEAYEWGLVEQVVDPGRAFDAALELARKVASQPPLSVAMTKLTVNRLTHALDDLASHMDVDQFALASLSEDHKEGVEAFLGRRKPRFRGRWPFLHRTKETPGTRSPPLSRTADYVLYRLGLAAAGQRTGRLPVAGRAHEVQLEVVRAARGLARDLSVAGASRP